KKKRNPRKGYQITECSYTLESFLVTDSSCFSGTGLADSSKSSSLFISTSWSLYLLNKNQKRTPARAVAPAIDANIITNFGCSEVGERAIPRAEPKALVSK